MPVRRVSIYCSMLAVVFKGAYHREGRYLRSSSQYTCFLEVLHMHLHQVGESSIRYSLEEPLLYDSSPTNLLALDTAREPDASCMGIEVRVGASDVLVRWVSIQDRFPNERFDLLSMGEPLVNVLDLCNTQKHFLLAKRN